MNRLLVTGGAGFIGSNFVHHCLRAEPDSRIVVLDALTYAGNLSNLQAALGDSRFRFVRGDICDADLAADVIAEERIDCIVHFAAESHVDRSISGPDEFVRTNVLGTHALLKAARACWTKNGRPRRETRFHHISTDEVYGSVAPGRPGVAESAPYAPSSPYAASKAASDHLVNAYFRTYELPVTISHCSNNYGPYQFPEKLIPRMIVAALDGDPLPVYGTGENLRDWLHVEDHCRAVLAILRRGQPGKRYNVSAGNERRNLDIIRLLCSLVDERIGTSSELGGRFPHCPAVGGTSTTSLITFVADRPGHDLRYAMDDSRARRELDFSPQVGFEAGLADTVDWYLANEPWWRAVQTGEYRNLPA